MASLLDIGITGLRTSQTSLQITGNNIANADVESYSRQRTEVSVTPEQNTGSGFIGSGSQVEAINRIVNEFIIKQVRSDTATYKDLAAFGDNIEQLDSLLAGELSSLSPSVAALFTAIEVGAEDPVSTPARQLILSEAGGFSERLHTLYDRMVEQGLTADSQMRALTTQVSSLTESIAELNVAITRELGTGAQPNGMLDSRDELLRQLAEIVSVSTTEQSNGAVNVFVGSGQPLVIGGDASAMGVTQNPEKPQSLDITYIGASGVSTVITSAIKGGELGGLLRFRDEALEPALNSLGRITLAITDSMNQQNKQGIDLEGNIGGLIFTDINTAAAMSDRATTVTGTATLDVLVNDMTGLSADNYSLSITDATPAIPPASAGSTHSASLTNQATGEIILGAFSAAGDFEPTDPTKTEGVQISMSSGALAVNDRFYIQPTRNAARDVSMQMQRPQELAFSAPIIAGGSLTNTGGGAISTGEVIEAYDRFDNPSPAFATPGVLTPPILIQFTSATAYDVIDNTNPAVPVTLFSAAFVPGADNPVFPTSAGANYMGYQVNLSGSPATGDTFNVDFNAAGISDNRNAVSLGQLRSTAMLDGSTLSFEDSYGQLVEDLGTTTAQNRISSEASLSLLQSSVAGRSSVSGVNLDEEAANLIRFEQAYNASAQMINVARQLFDTLISSIR